MNKASRLALLCVSALFFAQGWQVAAAQEHGRPEPGRAEGRPEGRGPAPGRPDARGQVLDERHNHGRYYPPMGTVRPALPEGYRPYYRGRDRYYFNGGIWYAPRGPGFVVVRPPPGLVISVLPPYYSTVWFGGVPYYYADNVYYSWQPDQNGYAVVDPPADGDAPSSPPDSRPRTNSSVTTGPRGKPASIPPSPEAGPRAMPMRREAITTAPCRPVYRAGVTRSTECRCAAPWAESYARARAAPDGERGACRAYSTAKILHLG